MVRQNNMHDGRYVEHDGGQQTYRTNTSRRSQPPSYLSSYTWQNDLPGRPHSGHSDRYNRDAAPPVASSYSARGGIHAGLGWRTHGQETAAATESSVVSVPYFSSHEDLVATSASRSQPSSVATAAVVHQVPNQRSPRTHHQHHFLLDHRESPSNQQFDTLPHLRPQQQQQPNYRHSATLPPNWQQQFDAEKRRSAPVAHLPAIEESTSKVTSLMQRGKKSLKRSKASLAGTLSRGGGSLLSLSKRKKKNRNGTEASSSTRDHPRIANWAVFAKEQGKPISNTGERDDGRGVVPVVQISKPSTSVGTSKSPDNWQKFLAPEASDVSEDELAKVNPVSSERTSWIPYHDLSEAFPGRMKAESVLILHHQVATKLIERYEQPVGRTSIFADAQSRVRDPEENYDHLCCCMRATLRLCPCLKTIMHESLQPYDDAGKPLLMSEGCVQTDNVSGYSALGGSSYGEPVSLLSSDDLSIWRETHPPPMRDSRRPSAAEIPHSAEPARRLSPREDKMITNYGSFDSINEMQGRKQNTAKGGGKKLKIGFKKKKEAIRFF